MKNLFLTDVDVGERYGVVRGTIWRWIKKENFPKPVSLSPGCTRWKLSDIEEWETEKAQDRQAI